MAHVEGQTIAIDAPHFHRGRADWGHLSQGLSTGIAQGLKRPGFHTQVPVSPIQTLVVAVKLCR